MNRNCKDRLPSLSWGFSFSSIELGLTGYDGGCKQVFQTLKNWKGTGIYAEENVEIKDTGQQKRW